MGLRNDPNWSKVMFYQLKKTCFKGYEAKLIYAVHGISSGPFKSEWNFSLRLRISQRQFKYTDSFPENQAKSWRNHRKGH